MASYTVTLHFIWRGTRMTVEIEGEDWYALLGRVEHCIRTLHTRGAKPLG